MEFVEGGGDGDGRLNVTVAGTASLFWPVSSEGSGPVSLRLGNLRLTVTAVLVSVSL